MLAANFEGAGDPRILRMSPSWPRPRLRWAMVLSTLLASVLVLSLASVPFRHWISSEQAVLFINDIHLDPHYNNRSNSTTWCHETIPSLSTTFPFGRYGCDTTIDLFASFLENTPKIVGRPTAIVIGGDMSAGVYNPLPEYFLPIVQTVRSGLETAFPGVPILPALGNGEFSPNYGIWSNDSLNYAHIVEAWNGLLRPTQVNSYLTGGYCYRDIGPVRLVVLNTVMYHVAREFSGEADPHGQLAWLDQICADASNRGKGVVVFFHAPPSIGARRHLEAQGWHQTYADGFADIYYKHRFAMFSGHFHVDALLPLFDGRGRRGGFVLSAPSLSARHDTNPAFRVIRLRGGRVVDYDQYFTDIIGNPTEALVWRREYSFRALYGVEDLSEGELVKLSERIKNESDTFWKYRSMMYVSNYDRRAFHACLLTSVGRDDLERCLAESPEYTRKS
jgi:hypothetical protein